MNSSNKIGSGDFPEELLLETSYSSVGEIKNPLAPLPPPVREDEKEVAFGDHTMTVVWPQQEHPSGLHTESFQHAASSGSLSHDGEPIHQLTHLKSDLHLPPSTSSTEAGEPSLEERMLLRSPHWTPEASFRNYATFPPLPPPPSEHEDLDFSRPYQWDRQSIVEAESFYQAKAEETSHAELKLHYQTLSSYLRAALHCQENLHRAYQRRKADIIGCYFNAFTRYYQDAITSLRVNAREVAALRYQQARECERAASHFEEVISLVQPDAITGPLAIKLRHDDRSEVEYNLSAFSFQEANSMRNYYAMITSKKLIGGSNIATLQQQKSLLEDAFSHLENVRRIETRSTMINDQPIIFM